MLRADEIDHFLEHMSRYDLETFSTVMPDLLDYAMRHMVDDEIGRYEMLVYYLDGYCAGGKKTDDQFRRERKTLFFAQVNPDLSLRIYDFLALLKSNTNESAIFHRELDCALLFWKNKIEEDDFQGKRNRKDKECK